MLKKYCVNINPQSSWEHEVHKTESCNNLPLEENRLDLWYHKDCHDAVKKAKETYSNVDWCEKCCPSCHTR